MTFPRTRFPLYAGLLLSFLLLAIFSCNITTDGGHTYLNVKKDTAWTKFDSLEITWNDSVSGKGGVLFQGNPSTLSAVNKLPADGYAGQKINVTIKGFNAKQLTYQEIRTFDSADPGASTKQVMSPDESNLSDMAISAGRLSPPFGPLVLAYVDTVTFDVTSVTVSPTAKGAIKVNGTAVPSGQTSSPIDLKTGVNAFAVTVLLPGAEGKVYSITVFRRDASNDAGLQSLSLSAGALDKPFNSSDTLYTVSAPNSVSSTTVTAAAAQSASTLSINGFSVTSGSVSGGINLSIGETAVTVIVTAPGGAIKTYHIKVLRAGSGNSSLAALKLSAGNLVPAFSDSIKDYSLAVANSVTATQITASTAGAASTLTINGQPAFSDTAFPVNLVVGANSIVVGVTSQSGNKSAYTIQVTRAGDGNADLSVLSLSAGTISGISGAFSPDAVFYTLAVANTVTATTVTTTAAKSSSTVTINKQDATAGQPLSVNLDVGSNTITVVVTAQNGDKKNYSVVVTRAPNANTDLSGLKLSAGAFTPTFAAGTLTYTLSVTNDIDSTTVTPAASAATSAISVNGSATASGSVSAPIHLSIGGNPIAVVVTSQSGVSKTYSITVTRLPSADTTLAGLAVSAGSLTPIFNPATSSYAVAVGNGTASIVITPKAASAAAKIKIGVDSVASGAASKAIPLAVGSNAIIVTVIAENLSSRNYYLQVTRAKNGNSDLDSLETSLGPVSPDFSKVVKAYVLNAPFHAQAFTLRAKTHQATTRLSVNGTPLVSGANSDSIPLAQAQTTVRLTATAEDSSSQTYVITVTRDTVGNELISNFETRSDRTSFGTYWNYYDDRANKGNSLITSGDTSGAVTLINQDSWKPGYGGSQGALRLAFRYGQTPPSCGTGCTYGNYVAINVGIHTIGSQSADLTGATSISFYAKSDTALSINFQVQTSDILDFGYYLAVVPITTSWALYTVNLAEGVGARFLTQPTWAITKPFNIKKVSGINFEIRREENPVLGQGELLLDDVYINNWRQ